MPRSWSQFESDSYRLPHGITRVAYDSESRRYTFRDTDGQMYQGRPGEDYGVMTPMTSPPQSGMQAPPRQEPTIRRHKTTVDRQTGPPPKTFADILSKDQIATAAPIDSSETSKTTLLRRSSVTAALKRSRTSATAYLKAKDKGLIGRKPKRSASEYTQLKS